MSANVVEKAHIDALVTAGLELPGQYGPLRWFDTIERPAEAYAAGEPWGPGALPFSQQHERRLTRDTAGMVGAMLWAENRRSVNHRYAEDEWEAPYLYTPKALDVVSVLKALDGYEYQSCEHPGWEASEAAAYCDALRRAAIKRLPGYDESDAWAVHDDTPATAAPVDSRSYGSEYDANMSAKDCAAAMRKTIRARAKAGELPGDWKYSVRYRSFAGGCAVDITATSPRPIYAANPDSYAEPWALHAETGEHVHGWKDRLTGEARGVLDQLDAIHNSHNHDGSDIQTDYFDVKFYGHASIETAAGVKNWEG